MTDYTKPLPPITDLNRPFFEGGRHGQLNIQHCQHCEKLIYPIAQHCPRCLSVDLGWKVVSGRAKLWSWVVFHKVYIKSFAQDAPYPVAFVELEEGPQLICGLKGANLTQLRCDMPLEVTFDQVKDGVWLPLFTPAVETPADTDVTP